MDSLIILMQEVLEKELQAGWVSRNINWLITVATSLLTIIIVNHFTKKQMDNQNIESHKPCITITKVAVSNLSPNKYLYAQYEKEKNEKTSPPQYENKLIEFKNIGYGVASEIEFQNIKVLSIDKIYYLSSKKNVPKNDDMIFIKDLAAGDSVIIDIIVKIPSDVVINENTNLNYELRYKDLNENKYTSLHFVGLVNNDRDYICGHFPLRGTKAFKRKNKELNNKKKFYKRNSK